MLTPHEFEKILKSSESFALDFKSSMHAVIDDKDLLNTAKLAKDIISISRIFYPLSKMTFFSITEHNAAR
ncbi:hypothetical protein SAMN05660236_4787 [Ohtaekwangia koreensis]|uniref:Uncharacterized protein n=1 Tax=Ohtaekwangia koreensis TaxID=688867 RepID=A0A1T5M9U8_9BACT|nr:hypothetical protein SAMN05660236_4787 [Ohtaekwangia koreensis]